MVLYFIFFFHILINVYIFFFWGLKDAWLKCFSSFSFFLSLGVVLLFPKLKCKLKTIHEVRMFSKLVLKGLLWVCFRSECDLYFMLQCGPFHINRIEMETLNCFNQRLAITEEGRNSEMGKQDVQAELCLACPWPCGSPVLSFSLCPNLCHEDGHRPGSSTAWLGWELFHDGVRANLFLVNILFHDLLSPAQVKGAIFV